MLHDAVNSGGRAEAVLTVQPDYECNGCGNAVWGKEPVRCVKCRGMSFKPLRRSKGEARMTKMGDSLLRIQRDVEELAAELKRCPHRRRRTLLTHFQSVREGAAKAYKVLLDTPEPKRGGAKQKSGGGAMGIEGDSKSI